MFETAPIHFCLPRSGEYLGAVYSFPAGEIALNHNLCSGKKTKRSILSLALVFSALLLLSSVKKQRYGSVSAVLYWLFLFAGFFLAASVLFRRIQRQNEKAPVSRSKSRVFWASFLFLLLCWLPYYLGSFPGNTAWDTGSAILTHLGSEQNFNNPPFLILLYGLVYRAGSLLGGFHISVAVYCTLQMLLYLLVYSRSMVLVSRSKAPLWLQCAVLLLLGLLPVFPMYALCMGKDSSFGLGLLVFCLGIYEQLQDDGFFSDKLRMGGFLCACVLTPLTRNGAFWIIAAFLMVLLLVQVRRKGGRRIFLSVALAATVLSGLFFPSKADIGENLSIPLQQIAYCLQSHPLSQQEQEIVSRVIPVDAFQNYDPQISDPIKKHFRHDASDQEVLDFLAVWLKQAVKHPISYCKSFYLHTDGYYTPGLLYNHVKPHLQLGLQGSEAFRELANWPPKNGGLKLISRFDRLLSNTAGLQLLQSIGFYTWIALFTIAFCLGDPARKHPWLELTPLLPAVLVLLGCCFSPVNGYFRYAYPAVCCIPIFSTLVLFSPGESQPQ